MPKSKQPAAKKSAPKSTKKPTPKSKTSEQDSQEGMRETSAVSPEVFIDPNDANQRVVDNSVERGDRITQDGNKT